MDKSVKKLNLISLNSNQLPDWKPNLNFLFSSMDEKVILIGCDDSGNLSQICRNLASVSLFRHSIISATRVTDINGIVKSVTPHLILLCFRNNAQVLRDMMLPTVSPEIPIIFLTMQYDYESDFWKRGHIIFTYPFSGINNAHSFCSRIQSVFLLRNGAPAEVQPATFAMAAQNRQSNNADLSRYVMELDQKVEILQKVKDRIAFLYPKVDDLTRTELISIANTIKSAAGDNKLWEDFKIHFEKTNPSFLLTLAQKHPELSPKDLKYCCYIKMNMSNNDITSLLGINQESVRTHKYRLKKKMVLPKEQNIVSYLRSVG